MKEKDFVYKLKKIGNISSYIKTKKMVKVFWETIMSEIEEAEEIKFKGYGVFKIQRLNSRKFLSFITGEKKEVEVEKRMRLKFVQGKLFREKIEENFQKGEKGWSRKSL